MAKNIDMNESVVRNSFHIRKILHMEEAYCDVLFGCRDGEGKGRIWQLPGDTLIAFFDFAAEAYLIGKSRRPNVLEINFCHTGRMEHRLSDDSFLYMGAGDCNFALESSHTEEAVFPTKRYQGVGIVIDVDKQMARKDESYGYALGGDLTVLLEKIKTYGNDLTITPPQGVADFYEIPEQISAGLVLSWLQLKLNALLLWLQGYEPATEKAPEGVARKDVESVKAAHRAMTCNLTRWPKTAELAKNQYMSESKFKKLFKEIYGAAPGQYMTKYRMERAAELLTATDLAVSAVAAKIGYQNAGNFSVAFKSHFGMTPSAYRHKDYRP